MPLAVYLVVDLLFQKTQESCPWTINHTFLKHPRNWKNNHHKGEQSPEFLIKSHSLVITIARATMQLKRCLKDKDQTPRFHPHLCSKYVNNWAMNTLTTTKKGDTKFMSSRLQLQRLEKIRMFLTKVELKHLEMYTIKPPQSKTRRIKLKNFSSSQFKTCLAWVNLKNLLVK